MIGCTNVEALSSNELIDPIFSSFYFFSQSHYSLAYEIGCPWRLEVLSWFWGGELGNDQSDGSVSSCPRSQGLKVGALPCLLSLSHVCCCRGLYSSSRSFARKFQVGRCLMSLMAQRPKAHPRSVYNVFNASSSSMSMAAHLATRSVENWRE